MESTSVSKVLEGEPALPSEVAASESEVFEDRSRFLSWMKHPNKAFANKTPMSLLDSKHGVDMVLNELGRIEHGVFV